LVEDYEIYVICLLFIASASDEFFAIKDANIEKWSQHRPVNTPGMELS
jgi:hypothetical protein